LILPADATRAESDGLKRAADVRRAEFGSSLDCGGEGEVCLLSTRVTTWWSP